MLLVANLAITKLCKRNLKITETLAHEYLYKSLRILSRAFQWILTLQGLDCFQKTLRCTKVVSALEWLIL